MPSLLSADDKTSIVGPDSRVGTSYHTTPVLSVTTLNLALLVQWEAPPFWGNCTPPTAAESLEKRWVTTAFYLVLALFGYFAELFLNTAGKSLYLPYYMVVDCWVFRDGSPLCYLVGWSPEQAGIITA